MKHSELVTDLLAAGAQHNLCTAILRRDWQWVEKRVDITQLNSHFNGNVNGFAADFDCYTPLIAAVVRNDLKMVQILLEKGADPYKLRKVRNSCAINYAQVYDQDAKEKFPILREMLDRASKERRPPDWRDARDRCSPWIESTHDEAREPPCHATRVARGARWGGSSCSGNLFRECENAIEILRREVEEAAANPFRNRGTVCQRHSKA